jgi:SOS response regulatory protein OraA/RecX
VPVVTALRAQRPSRVIVELDGTTWRTLPAEPVVRAGLRVGCELDRPTARRLARELRRFEAFAVAGRSLRHGDLSSQALEARLRRAKVAEATGRQAVEALERAGVVDDRRFAVARASALAGRGYGDVAIRDDLERRGISGGLLEEALAELEPEPDRARELVRRRGADAKTARLLAARGFAGDAVEAAFGADFANSP